MIVVSMNHPEKSKIPVPLYPQVPFLFFRLLFLFLIQPIIFYPKRLLSKMQFYNFLLALAITATTQAAVLQYSDEAGAASVNSTAGIAAVCYPSAAFFRHMS